MHRARADSKANSVILSTGLSYMVTSFSGRALSLRYPGVGEDIRPLAVQQVSIKLSVTPTIVALRPTFSGFAWQRDLSRDPLCSSTLISCDGKDACLKT